MFRFMRKREGFTLIELMMVVAVIGILAAVLIPKIGGTKDSAKITGVETNARTVHAIIESEIARYQSTAAANPGNFATRIASKCVDIVNPFTNVRDGGVVSDVPSTQPTTAVVVDNDPSDSPPSSDDPDLRGAVIVTISTVSNAVYSATITPFDDLGGRLNIITVNR